MTKESGLSFSAVEQKVRQESWQRCSRELQVTESFLNVFLDAFLSLKGLKPASLSKGHLVQLLYIYRSFASLRCGYEIAQRGHYVQAAQLIRHALEDFVVCKHIQRDPNLAEDLLQGEENRLNFTQMAQQEGHEFQRWWLKGYRDLSNMAHPRSFGLSRTIPLHNGLRIGPFFDRQLLLAMIDYILKILLPYGQILQELLEIHNASIAQNWLRRSGEKINDVHSILDQIEKDLQ